MTEKSLIEWIESNPTYMFYILVGTQNSYAMKHAFMFSNVVVSYDKIPVFISNVGAGNKPFPLYIQEALLNETARIYEVAKVATKTTLLKRTKIFQNLYPNSIIYNG
jgi:DNA-binding phage protein